MAEAIAIRAESAFRLTVPDGFSSFRTSPESAFSSFCTALSS